MYIVFVFLYNYVVHFDSHVRISISENQPFDSEASGDVNSGGSGDRSATIGNPLTLECTIRVSDTSGPFAIFWTTGSKLIRRVDNITDRSYTDYYVIPSLSAIDNGRIYLCSLIITHPLTIYDYDHLRLNFPGEYVASYNCLTYNTLSHALCS